MSNHTRNFPQIVGTSGAQQQIETVKLIVTWEKMTTAKGHEKKMTHLKHEHQMVKVDKVIQQNKVWGITDQKTNA